MDCIVDTSLSGRIGSIVFWLRWKSTSKGNDLVKTNHDFLDNRIIYS